MKCLTSDEVSEDDQELGDLLVRIRQGLREDQYIDFSLMIRNAVDVIRVNAPGVEKGIGKLSHLMVDEYQDVNPLPGGIDPLSSPKIEYSVCRRR